MLTYLLCIGKFMKDYIIAKMIIMRPLTKLMILSGLTIVSSCKPSLNSADQKKWDNIQAATKPDFDLVLHQMNDCDSVLLERINDADIDAINSVRKAALEMHEKNFSDLATKFHEKHPDASVHYRYDQPFRNMPAIWMSGKVNGKELSTDLISQKYQLALIIQ
jgi:hypothetical protein